MFYIRMMMQGLVVINIVSNTIYTMPNRQWIDGRIFSELKDIEKIENTEQQQLLFAQLEKRCTERQLEWFVKQYNSFSGLLLYAKKMALSQDLMKEGKAIEAYLQASTMVCDIATRIKCNDTFENVCKRHETTLAKQALMLMSKRDDRALEALKFLDENIQLLKMARLPNITYYFQQIPPDMNNQFCNDYIHWQANSTPPTIHYNESDESNKNNALPELSLEYPDYHYDKDTKTYHYIGMSDRMCPIDMQWVYRRGNRMNHKNDLEEDLYDLSVLYECEDMREDALQQVLPVQKANEENIVATVIKILTREPEIQIEESQTLGILIKPVEDTVNNNVYVIEEIKNIPQEEVTHIDSFIDVHNGKQENEHKKPLPIAVQEQGIPLKNGFDVIANLPSSCEPLDILDQPQEIVVAKKKKKSRALRIVQKKEKCESVILSYKQALKNENDPNAIAETKKKLYEDLLFLEQYVNKKDQISGTVMVLLADLYSKNCADMRAQVDADYEKSHTYYQYAFERVDDENREEVYTSVREFAQLCALPVSRCSKKNQKRQFFYAEFWYKKLLEAQVSGIALPLAYLYKLHGKIEQANALLQEIIQNNNAEKNERFVALLQSTLLRVSEMPDEKASVWCGLLSLMSISEIDYPAVTKMLDDDSCTQLITLGQNVVTSNSENQTQLTFLHLAGRLIMSTHYDQGKKFLEYAALHGQIDSLQYILKNIDLNPDEIIQYHNYCKGNAQIPNVIHDLLKERILQAALSGNQRLINMWLRTAKDTIEVQQLVDKLNELQQEIPIDNMEVFDADTIDWHIKNNVLLSTLLTQNDPLVTWLYIRAQLKIITNELVHDAQKDVFGIDCYELKYKMFEDMCNTMSDTIFKKSALANLYCFKIVLARQYLLLKGDMRDECRAMEYGISLLPVVPPCLLDEVIKLIGALGLLGNMELKPEWLKAVEAKDDGTFKQWCVKQLEKFAEQGDCDTQNVIAHYIIKKDVATPAEYMQAGRYLKQSSVNKNPNKTLDVSAVYAQIMLQQAGNALNQLVACDEKPNKRSLKQFKEKCFERDLLRLQCGTANFCNKNMTNLRKQAASIMKKSFITDQEINYIGEFLNFIIAQYPESKNLKREANDILDYVNYMVGLYDRGGIGKETFMKIMHKGIAELYTSEHNIKNDKIKKKLNALFTVMSMLVQMRGMTILLVPMK